MVLFQLYQTPPMDRFLLISLMMMLAVLAKRQSLMIAITTTITTVVEGKVPLSFAIHHKQVS